MEQIIAMLSLKRREKTTTFTDDDKIDQIYIYSFFWFYIIFNSISVLCLTKSVNHLSLRWCFLKLFSVFIYRNAEKKPFFAHLIALNLLMVQLLAENFHLNEWIWMSHACVRVNERMKKQMLDTPVPCMSSHTLNRN